MCIRDSRSLALEERSRVGARGTVAGAGFVKRASLEAAVVG